MANLFMLPVHMGLGWHQTIRSLLRGDRDDRMSNGTQDRARSGRLPLVQIGLETQRQNPITPKKKSLLILQNCSEVMCNMGDI